MSMDISNGVCDESRLHIAKDKVETTDPCQKVGCHVGLSFNAVHMHQPIHTVLWLARMIGGDNMHFPALAAISLDKAATTRAKPR